ncbi:MAG: hypothetical protein WCA56_19240 [Xanthobacteraceae bacterium]
MANLLRMKKVTARVNEREFPFVVQIAVPDGGFECTLDAINAWHCYSKNKQRRGPRHRDGEQEFWRWCFDGLEIAKSFRQRFGGEIMPVTLRQRHELPRTPAPRVVGPEPGGPEATERKAQAV